jgi:PAS domain S-box-containing protein
MATTPELLRDRTGLRLLAAALVPLGIAILRLTSGSVQVPDEPAVLLTLVVFSGLLGGVWIGLLAAALQLLYALWFFSGAEAAAGAAPIVQWSLGKVFGLALSPADAKRFIVYAITSPVVAIAAGLSRRKLDKSRRSTTTQEQFANTIFEKAGVAIAYADLDGHILRCNQFYADMVGRSQAEVVGMNFRDLVDPRDREENWTLSRQLVAGLTDKISLENRYIRKDGVSVWARKVVTLIRDGAGDPGHLLLFATDLTEEMALKADLERSQANYRTLWESAGNANFLVFAPGFTIERANEAAVRFFGARDPFDLASLRLADLSPATQDDGEVSAEKERRLLDDALRDGSATAEWLFRSRDGREAYATLKLARIDADGRAGLQCSALDITDRVLLSRHLADAQRLLAEEVNARTAELEDVTYELHLAQSLGGMGSFSVDLVAGTFSCSPETARILNIEDFDQIKNAEWAAKVHPGDRPAVIQAWQRAIEGAPYDVTYRIMVPGGVRHVKSGARFKRDGNGKAISAIGALLDLTSLLAKRDQTVLRGHRARVDGLLAATAAIQADAELNIDTDTGTLAASLLQQFPDWTAEELETVIEQAIATIKGTRH